ncbi:MAG: nitroreductase family deazaflavin-dependent oxidoreductase [Acidimicrobiia bacterium]
MRFARRSFVVVLVLGGVFVVGMRRKWPPVLDAVRRASRAFKPVVLKKAGSKGASASVVRHVGRTSGRQYETPVVAMATPDGFAIALPYGANTDWLKNVLAGGHAQLVTEGSEYTVEHPEVVPIADVDAFFAPKERRLHRQFAVESALVVRRRVAEGSDASGVAASTGAKTG